MYRHDRSASESRACNVVDGNGWTLFFLSILSMEKKQPATGQKL